MKTLKEFAVENNLKLTLIKVPFRTDREGDEKWNKEASHYLFMIEVTQGTNFGKPAIKGNFSQGSAIKNKPTFEDILNSLSLDIMDLDGSFEDWASNCGYDLDSRKAFETYQACLSEKEMIIALLGIQGLEELHECEQL